MSGSNATRDDTPGAGSGSSGVGAGSVDTCQRVRRGPINSPKASVLAPLAVGSVLGVIVRTSGVSPVLVVTDTSGVAAGSLTFIGYLELIDCIRNRGVTYKATIINISGGVYEVRVEPI